jgi:hypothetical protein
LDEDRLAAVNERAPAEGDADEDISARGLLILLLVFLVPILLVLGITAGLSWAKERDLRGDNLLRTKARVVDVNLGGRGARDKLEVEFTARNGTRVSQELLVSYATRSDKGKEIGVLYVGSNPQRVRPVEGWEPWYEVAAFWMIASLVSTPVLFVWIKWVDPAWNRIRKRA